MEALPAMRRQIVIRKRSISWIRPSQTCRIGQALSLTRSKVRNFSVSLKKSRIDKIYASAAEAIMDMKPDTTLVSGGFGLCGVPDTLINEVLNHSHITGLIAVSNNAGTKDSGLSLLLRSKQIKKMIASYIGTNEIFQRMYLNGELEVELTPQGTLAERCRAGGAGVPAFYTPAAFGTVVQTGKLPLTHSAIDGTPNKYSYPKDVKVFNGKPYLLENAIMADYAFVRAYKADRLGNCQFRLTANNFNGPMGRNAKMTIVEAEHIVEVGELGPDQIDLPGIYVKRVVQAKTEKRIEIYVNSTEDEPDPAKEILGSGEGARRRERIAKRAAKEFHNGDYVNLGIGIPCLAASYVSSEIEVQVHSENGILGMGSYPRIGEEDADLINSAKETTTSLPGASFFSSDESFGMIRSGRIDVTILGGLQVNTEGDLANCKGWSLELKDSVKLTNTIRDGTRKDQRFWWRHGSSIKSRADQSHRDDGAHRQERQTEDREPVFSASHGQSLCLHDHY